MSHFFDHLPDSLQLLMASIATTAIEGGAWASTTLSPVSQSKELSGSCYKFHTQINFKKHSKLKNHLPTCSSLTRSSCNTKKYHWVIKKEF